MNLLRTQYIYMLIFGFIFSAQVQSNDGTIKVSGTLPETIEIIYEDPHCNCLLSDYFSIVDNNTGETIYFLDDKNYIKKYYYMQSEEDSDGYGSALYGIKPEYSDQTFTITYKVDLCPGYKKCNEGKIYKNKIVSIK
ncbi:hypothetical protein LBMAG35_16270 [Chlorobiota bacterium]|jgi:hypothetical protein|nr:hypothetical protein LBMAG35_16270 [Chlorobiota bacterium]